MSQLPPFSEISENLTLLDDWEDRYRYLIELGRMLPPMPDAEKTAAARVHGCTSQVWLTVDETGEPPENRLWFRGDSDAMIVKGLVAVLIAFFGGRTPSEIAAADAVAELDTLGLREHLTTQRSNGLVAMVQRIRSEAASRS